MGSALGLAIGSELGTALARLESELGAVLGGMGLSLGSARQAQPQSGPTMRESRMLRVRFLRAAFSAGV